MLTESEAKNKWCPFARVQDRNGHSGNRLDPWYKEIADDKERTFFEAQENNCKCIASDCMAWRFIPGQERTFPKYRRGYCGLAGKPEVVT